VEQMMMTTSCPEHGKLALELARGELALDAAVEAEAVVERCPHCAAMLESLAHPEVAAGVEAAWANLELPRARRRWWAAAAAAAVLVIAGGVALLPRIEHHQRSSAELVHSVFTTSKSPVQDLNHDGRVDAADLALALQHTRSATPRS
jgi:hypothetical protein